ncbi:MAG TPA: hypothetical protein VFV98_18290 [Vicinamibacterales bacterium]|nr:hypothetical protein [Vicinamibacterales bacterium]
MSSSNEPERERATLEPERDPRLSQLLGGVIRSSIRVSAMILFLGLVLFLAMPSDFSERLLLAGILLVVIAPVLNVLQVLIDEMARKEWPFVATTCVVVAMLAWTLF